MGRKTKQCLPAQDFKGGNFYKWKLSSEAFGESVKVLEVVGRVLCSVSCFEKQDKACTSVLPE